MNFKTPTKLANHLKVNHKQATTFSCNKCGYNSSSVRVIKEHSNTCKSPTTCK